MAKMITINIYDESETEINILDSGVVLMDESDIDQIVDIALEIAMRKKMNINYDIFVDRLNELCKDYL